MKRRLLVPCVALACVHLPARASAQFTDAHSYDAAPVGINQVELSYAFVRANASIDPSIVITGAILDLNQGTASYTRYFGVFHRLTWVEAGIPAAGLSGSINGTNVRRSTTGAGDSSFAVAMLLKGGPALSVAQFASYQKTTTLGVSLAVTAPTGSYHPDQLLNLGADRWSFKPEIALSLPFGRDQKWQMDAFANVYFFTDNTTYRGREILRQEALPGFEGHLSYAFNDRVWVSFDTRYSFRGTTFVDGVDQANAQKNVVVGSELNVSINARHSVLFEFAKALLHENGPALVGFSVKYDYAWGRGYH